MIAHAPHLEDFLVLIVLAAPDLRAFSRMPHRRVVTEASRGFDPRAVVSFPDELLIHPVFLEFEGAHENVGILAAFLHDLD